MGFASAGGHLHYNVLFILPIIKQTILGLFLVSPKMDIIAH